MKFERGAVVHHKVMGKETALKEVDENGEKKIEVRMSNGHIQKFYPEELESDEEVKARDANQIAGVMKMNEENAKRWKI